MSTKILAAIAIVIILGAGGWLIYKNKNNQSQSVKIGFIGPLTGDAASTGLADKAAVEVAVDEVNKSGGINGHTLEVIFEDGQCDAKTANTAASKLINVDQVPVIIGGLCSNETGAFGQMAMEKKVIVFSYGSSAPALSQLGKYFFRSYPSDSFEGKFDAEYAYNNFGARKIAIAYHLTDFATQIKNVFEPRFKELGGEIVSDEGAAQESRDYRTMLTKIKAANPDLIYLLMYPEGATVLMRQAEALGLQKKIFGDAVLVDPKLQKDIKDLKLAVFYPEIVTPKSPDSFRSAVLAKTGGDQVPVSAPQAYDNVKIITEMMKEFGTDTEKIQEEMHKLSYDGISGHIQFDANGDLTSANFVMKQIVNGEAVDVK